MQAKSAQKQTEENLAIYFRSVHQMLAHSLASISTKNVRSWTNYNFIITVSFQYFLTREAEF